MRCKTGWAISGVIGQVFSVPWSRRGFLVSVASAAEKDDVHFVVQPFGEASSSRMCVLFLGPFLSLFSVFATHGVVDGHSVDEVALQSSALDCASALLFRHSDGTSIGNDLHHPCFVLVSALSQETHDASDELCSPLLLARAVIPHLVGIHRGDPSTELDLSPLCMTWFTTSGLQEVLQSGWGVLFAYFSMLEVVSRGDLSMVQDGLGPAPCALQNSTDQDLVQCLDALANLRLGAAFECRNDRLSKQQLRSAATGATGRDASRTCRGSRAAGGALAMFALAEDAVRRAVRNSPDIHATWSWLSVADARIAAGQHLLRRALHRTSNSVSFGHPYGVLVWRVLFKIGAVLSPVDTTQSLDRQLEAWFLDKGSSIGLNTVRAERSETRGGVRQFKPRGRWNLAGLGHCRQRTLSLKVASLRSCLGFCEALGSQCEFVSFLNPDVLQKPLDARGGCIVSRHCHRLYTITPGAVTYQRSRGRCGRTVTSTRIGQQVQEAYVSISRAFPFEAPTWQPQLCKLPTGIWFSTSLAPCPCRTTVTFAHTHLSFHFHFRSTSTFVLPHKCASTFDHPKHRFFQRNLSESPPRYPAALGSRTSGIENDTELLRGRSSGFHHCGKRGAANCSCPFF